MNYACSYNFASGLTRETSHCLGYRFHAKHGFSPDRGESWIVRLGDGRVHPMFGLAGWLTGLHRTRKGRVFATDSRSRIFVLPNASPEAELETYDVPGTLTGVQGTDEKNVIAWGQRQGAPFAVRWNGKGFDPLPDPPGNIVAMHGLSSDLMMAVGAEGFIARWDGSAWEQMPSPVKTTLSAVFVASEDEIYVGGEGKDLLSGSIYGFTHVLRHDFALRAIAKWQDQIWIGAGGELGLCVLEKGKLVSLKPNITALVFDARGDLVISTMGAVIGTSDGKAFKGSLIAALAKTLDPTPMF